MTADISPELTQFLWMLAGLAGKMVWDAALNLFKNTISTPARVTKLQEDFIREFDAMKAMKANHERDIERNWQKYTDLEKRISEIENEKRANERRAT